MKRLVYPLILLLCFVMAGCDPSTPTPVPIMRVTVVVRDAETPDETAEPSPAPSSTPRPVCVGAPPVQLIVNQRGRVLLDDPSPLNIRGAPGTASNVLGSIDIGQVFYVLEGPECANGYWWFLIRHGSREGWIAEGDDNNYFVEPFLSG